jgi:hypothetical protein
MDSKTAFILWMLYAHLVMPLATLGVYHIGQGFGFLPSAIAFTPEAVAQMTEDYNNERMKESQRLTKQYLVDAKKK